MSYTIYYSDPNKANSPITVVDNTINTNATSLKLIGKNYPGYGQITVENLVHILENFAGPVPPTNPIEGQLWLDNSDPVNKKLKLNDGGISGSTWSPVNGVHQQTTEPLNRKVGDIWVDTSLLQLKIFNGTNFVLPQFNPTTSTNVSGVYRTGAYTETPLDSGSTLTNTVIVEYIDDTPVAIISKEAFTPNPVYYGFGGLTKGISLADGYILNGIADSANKLQTSAGAVPADNFLQKYVDQRMYASLSIARDANALQIGSNSTFVIQRTDTSGYTANFQNTYQSSGTNVSGRFTFDCIVNSTNKTLLTIDGASQSTSVTGDLNVSGKLNFMPAGTIMPYAGITPPAGWLLCNGASTSTLLYPILAGVVGTNYGIGGAGTFVLPDLRNTLIPVNTTTSINYIIRT